MRTTLDLPDDLMRAVRIRAAEENLKLKEVVAQLLRLGLSAASAERRAIRSRVRLPLVECAHAALPDEEITPERAAAILIEGDARNHVSLR